eukprot:100502-Pleurochrysis_carterae.AAC.2
MQWSICTALSYSTLNRAGSAITDIIDRSAVAERTALSINASHPKKSIDPPGGPSTQESRSNSGLRCAEPWTACLILGRTEFGPRV